MTAPIAAFDRLGTETAFEVLARANQLAAEGHDRLMLWVLVGNPAVSFYERLGGLTIAERDEKVSGARVRERAYGWWLT